MMQYRARSGKIAVVAGAAVLLLLIAGGVYWFLTSRKEPPEGKPPPGHEKTIPTAAASLDLVPADAPSFGTIALASWWNSAPGKRFQQEIAELDPSTEIEKILGVPPEKIERITLTVAKSGEPITILASTVALDRARVLSFLTPRAEEKKAGNSTYHVSDLGRSVHFANDRVFVQGNDQALEEYLTRPSKASVRTEGALKAAAALADKHLAVVAVDPQYSEFRKLLPENDENEFTKTLRPFLEARLGYLTLDLGEDLELGGLLTYADAATARSHQPKVKAALEMARMAVTAFRKEAAQEYGDSVVSPFFNFVDSLLRIASVEQEEASVRVSVQSEKGSLQQVVGALGPAVQKVRDAANRSISASNLKQIGLAMHSYADSQRGQLPTAAIYSKDGRPLLSWRVTLLPYLEQQPLYLQFKLDEPWDSLHNRKLLEKMPDVYKPVANAPRELHSTYYRVFTGPMTPFPGRMPLRLSDGFTDGTSNTILVIEAGQAVPWTKPDELVYDPQKPVPQLGGMFKDHTLLLRGDGSVYTLSRKISEKTLRAAITPAGGDVLGPDW